MPPPDLSTNGLLLRQYTLDDAEDAFAIYGDAEVMRFLGGDPVLDLEAQRLRLTESIARHAEVTDGLGRWAVVEVDSGRVVGTLILKPLPGWPHVEIGGIS